MGCDDKNLRFELTSWRNYISLAYKHRINDLIIEPFSEAIRINYCPWCGKKLTKETVNFDKSCCGNGPELIKRVGD